MNWWQYLLLVNVYLVLFYGFYALLLRKETFFQLNRVYLVCASALSFFIPVIQAGWVQNLFITQEVHYVVYGSQITISQLKPVADVPVSIGQVLACLYFIGVLFLAGRLIWQLVVLNKIIKSDQQGVAYSFFKKIKVDQHADNNSIINAHEQVHAQQWHSADVFIIEAVMIINWFNPVVYFYRRAIKHVHEFIADSHAIKAADNRADYAMLLLTKAFEAPTHNLVNHFFNHSLLKQRIIMLQKNKSQRIKLIKYGLSAPLFVLMLVLSSATVNNSRAVKIINQKAEQVLATPAITSTITGKPTDQSNQKPADIVTITSLKDQTAKKTGTIDLMDSMAINNSELFTAVEQAPSFPGGLDAFYKFLARNTVYPEAMRVNNIQGKVIVTFVVEKDGSLSNVRALRGPGYGANEEAVRVVSLSPKWTPGNQNGRAVRVQFTTSLMFSLSDAEAGTVANADSGKTDAIYIVDGKEMGNADAQAFLKNANNIMSINVKKDPSNRAKGIMEITTTENRDVTYFVDGKKVSAVDARVILNSNSYHTMGYGTDPSNKNTVYISTHEDKTIYTNEGIFGRADMTYIVDGKEVSEADAKSIARINGVQRIVLQKAPSPPNTKGVFEILTKKPADAASLPLIKPDPLYIIDGKEVKPADYKTVNPNDIIAIYVLNDKATVTQYGSKGKNGVILIYTKGYKGPIPAANTTVK